MDRFQLRRTCMKRYSVVQIGLGARGITHLKGFQNHQARIEIAGICDLQPERVEAVGEPISNPARTLVPQRG